MLRVLNQTGQQTVLLGQRCQGMQTGGHRGTRGRRGRDVGHSFIAVDRVSVVLPEVRRRFDFFLQKLVVDLAGGIVDSLGQFGDDAAVVVSDGVGIAFLGQVVQDFEILAGGRHLFL